MKKTHCASIIFGYAGALVYVTFSSNFLSIYSLEIVDVNCLVNHTGENISKLISL